MTRIGRYLAVGAVKKTANNSLTVEKTAEKP